MALLPGRKSKKGNRSRRPGSVHFSPGRTHLRLQRRSLLWSRRPRAGCARVPSAGSWGAEGSASCPAPRPCLPPGNVFPVTCHVCFCTGQGVWKDAVTRRTRGLPLNGHLQAAAPRGPGSSAPPSGTPPQAAAPVPLGMGGCGRSKAAIKDTPPDPSPAGPLSTILAPMGRPVLWRCLVKGAVVIRGPGLSPGELSLRGGSPGPGRSLRLTALSFMVARPRRRADLGGSPHAGWSSGLAPTPAPRPSPHVWLHV